LPTLIGIDVGTFSVKVVQIEERAKPRLINIFWFKTPYSKEAVGPSKVIDKNEFFNQIVSRIPIKTLKSSHIGINIPSPLVTVMVINLPKMTRRELETAAITEAKRKMVPAPLPDSIFEYLILGEVIVGKIPRYEVLVIKTEKNYIEEILDVFGMFGGIYPTLISPTCYTIVNLFPQDFPGYQKGTAFIDIGYESINITIAKKGKLHFYRNVKFGLNDVISRFSEALGLSAQETEEIIKREGVPEIDIDLKDRVRIAEEIMRQKYEASMRGESQQQVSPLELRMLWQEETERLVQDIRRTLIYYHEQSEGASVENLFFLGGGAKIKGLFRVLKERIGGELSILNPFGGMDIHLRREQFQQIREFSPLFVASTSIALSIPLARKREGAINFLPSDLKKRQRVLSRKIWSIVFSICFLVFILLGLFKVSIDNKVLKNNIKKVELELAEVPPDITDTLAKLKRQRRNIITKTKNIDQILKGRLDISGILVEVANLTPSEVFISSLSMAEEVTLHRMKGKPDQIPLPRGGDYKIIIKAVCLRDYEGAIELANEFRNSLAKSPLFKNIELVFPKLEKVSPVMTDPYNVVLTQPSLREFVLKANVVGTQIKNEEF
jgi:type IV pilus assembly protein PilM